MKILARVPNWIGDAVLCLPALESLSRSQPEASLSILARDWVRPLFSGCRFISQAIPLPTDSGLRSLQKFSRRLRERSFDKGVLFTNSFGSALMFAMADIPERWGYRRDGRGILLDRRSPRRRRLGPRHQVHDYLGLVAAMGADVAPPRLSLPLSEKAIGAADHLYRTLQIDPDGPFVIFNPGAFYGTAKRWPAERYSELAARLQREFGAEIAIIGSAAEKGLAEAIAAPLSRPARVLAGRTSLETLAGIIRRARLFVTNDSGPMHLAVALGIPTVAIFGPTDPAATGPFQEPSLTLKSDVVCWPCAYRDCPFDHRCMRSVLSDEVFEACRNYLE